MEKQVMCQKRGQLSPVNMKKFLRELERTGNLKASAAYVGVTPQAIYSAQKKIDGFKEACDVARDKMAHTVETEMRRRAIEGVEKGVYYKGELVATEREYSDSLLTMLAKANAPDRYGRIDDRLGTVEHKHSLDDKSIDKLAGLLGIRIIDVTAPSLSD